VLNAINIENVILFRWLIKVIVINRVFEYVYKRIWEKKDKKVWKASGNGARGK